MSNSGKSKAGSLKWAIDELSKQREDLDSKLKVARKRDETNALIQEVFAQKKALEQRISALEDGLRVSSDLVDLPCTDLESEMTKIDEKLEIAKERLEVIEQEEYLEELGKKLNRSHTPENESIIDEAQSDLDLDDHSLIEDLKVENADTSSSKTSNPNLPHTKPVTSFPQEESSTSTLMKATTNRIQAVTEEASEEGIAIAPASIDLQTNSSVTASSLQETAESLGVDPEFLAEKGLNAILRMIARNGGKLTFPLEVQQID